MKTFNEKYGSYALITGASSGIGAEFARQLEARGLNLLLVARRLHQLQQLAREITEEHYVDVRTIACDLSQADFMDDLRPHLEETDIGLLVNNAGFANTGTVVDNPLERELALLNVNCRAYLILAHELGNRLKANGRGGIIFISSSMAFTPAAYWGNYSASKAYELALGEAMYDELGVKGVDVLVVCPGPTKTDFYRVSNQNLEKISPAMRFIIVTPTQVVSSALESIGKKRSIIIGRGMKLLTQVNHFLPRKIASQGSASFIASIRID